MVCSHVAHSVLCDAFLLPQIVRFQRGLPRDIVELVRAHPGEEDASIAVTVARYGDKPTLQRLYALSLDQPAYFDENHFDIIWTVTLRSGRVEVARWLDSEPPLAGQLAAMEPSDVTAKTLWSGDVRMAAWLVETHPELVDRVVLRCCVTWLAHRSRASIVEWLETTSSQEEHLS